MPRISEERKRAYEESCSRREEAWHSLIRQIIDLGGTWQCCENRRCRRLQGCADPDACYRKHFEEIIAFIREVINPYLRERYPTVQWGAPASIVEVQWEAAIAAEREEAARREGRIVPKAGANTARARVPRHPLYDPKDV